MSQRYQRFVFVVATIIFKSSFIITTRVMFFIKTRLARDNMEIYLVSTYKVVLNLWLLSSLTIMHFTGFCFKEKEKLGYMYLQQPFKLNNQRLSIKVCAKFKVSAIGHHVMHHNQERHGFKT
jgi:hypothetical protein